MNSLRVIQILAKIGRVLSVIVFICCVVGFCACGLAIATLLIGKETVIMDGMTIDAILQTETGIGIGTILAMLFVAMISCVGEVFIAYYASRYFKHEMQAGTPFTKEGAKEMLHLGVRMIAFSLGTHIGAEIAQNIVAILMEGTELVTIDSDNSISLGITFIVVSLLCRHGAQLRDLMAKKK